MEGWMDDGVPALVPYPAPVPAALWPCPKPKTFSIFPTDDETDEWKGQPSQADKTTDIIYKF